MITLLYLAKPQYGGWVTFTAHLYKCVAELNPRLLTVAKTNKIKDFGYGIKSMSVPASALEGIGKSIITAVDKDFYYCLPRLYGAYLVIHDPTELTPELLPHLKCFRLITIRKSVRDFLFEKHGLTSHFILHPFYKYPVKESAERSGAVSISRVDFDKHTELILDANELQKGLKLEPIRIYGAVNPRYVFFKLKKYDFKGAYAGKFDKSFTAVSEILSKHNFMVDMSAIKNDGGGTQYTFLEAIHNGCALILNSKWATAGNNDFIGLENCFMARNGGEIINMIYSIPNDLREKVISKSNELLDACVGSAIEWRNLLK